MELLSDKYQRLVLVCATASVTLAVCSYAPSFRCWVRRRLQLARQSELDQGDLELHLNNCVGRGPALFAKYGVIMVANAIGGAELVRMQQQAKASFDEVLAARLRYLSSGGLEQDTWTFKEMCCRDGDRLDLQHGMDKEPFTSLADDGPWCAVVRSILGEDMRLISSGCIIASGHEDAEPQAWHMDCDHLFEGDSLPCHCLSAFVPLVDLTADNGSTEFSLGTHRNADHYPDGEVIFECKAGAAIVFDSRLLHRGTANRTATDRPLLYFTYAKAWYQDPINFRHVDTQGSVFCQPHVPGPFC